MANDEDLARIRQGVEVWNVWRAQHPKHPVNLNGADLGGMRLAMANLGGANLVGADLRGADLYQTVFGNVDLSRTKGLETCWHSGPSILDYLTLQQSGRLPLAFLRGC